MKQTPCRNLQAAVAILFIAVAALSFFLFSVKSDLDRISGIPAIQQSLKLQGILSNLQKLNETRNYPFLASLQEITPADVEQLKKQQPVIYNQLPDKNLYRIVLADSANNSVFLIYDLEGNRVLRLFGLGQAALGS